MNDALAQAPARWTSELYIVVVTHHKSLPQLPSFSVGELVSLPRVQCWKLNSPTHLSFQILIIYIAA